MGRLVFGGETGGVGVGEEMEVDARKMVYMCAKSRCPIFTTVYLHICCSWR